MAYGTILLLNGTSSSGKTSIISALRALRERPAFTVGIDHFNAMRPSKSCGDERVTEGMEMNMAFHQAIASFAENGWDVLVEHILVNPLYWRHCLTCLAPYPKLFIGVRCSLPLLEQREQERGDRLLGIARDQFDRVHVNKVYDIEVDTSFSTPEECALHIHRYLTELRPLRAFQQLSEAMKAE
ncbi:chloramphenicol phosphotransferase CPT family protein [Tengunoibacter tsumagoiensis]|uniref:Chloramphenicol phosphotransferase n=1 Tax=Tengunoibacter tsumagoiensis TaxID=2014871 RepID=A0A402A021_9CHLR|nr:chloramphenicol phosphotransferase [Tengunoibacter tsumagoiensis]GCE12497.1 chloramphenicol phosphotransferase [Tengunoibacter tsumagoiensis]